MGLLKMKLPICMVRRKKITTKEGEKTKPVKTLARIISPPHSRAKSVFKIRFSDKKIITIIHTKGALKYAISAKEIREITFQQK